MSESQRWASSSANDRDRLAADVLAADLATTGLHPIEENYQTAADRLIALGWRNLASPEFEERLARVTWDLEPCDDPDCPDKHIGYCKNEIAAIAKALLHCWRTPMPTTEAGKRFHDAIWLDGGAEPMRSHLDWELSAEAIEFIEAEAVAAERKRIAREVIARALLLGWSADHVDAVLAIVQGEQP